jgi:hypothetical protein
MRRDVPDDNVARAAEKIRKTVCVQTTGSNNYTEHRHVIMAFKSYGMLAVPEK